MCDPKRIWLSVFGFVFLVLPVVPSVVQADVPVVCLIGDHPGIPESDAQTAASLKWKTEGRGPLGFSAEQVFSEIHKKLAS